MLSLKRLRDDALYDMISRLLTVSHPLENQALEQDVPLQDTQSTLKGLCYNDFV